MPLKRRGPLVERISFGIIRVYLDDIEEIFSILSELTNDVRIQADDFVATEPQDLLDISSKTINELTIVATQPNVTVTLSGDTATLEARDAYNTTLGAVKRIEEVVRHRRRRLKRVIWKTQEQPPILVATAFALGILSLVLMLVALENTDPNSPPPNKITLDNEWVIGLYATKRGPRPRRLAVR